MGPVKTQALRLVSNLAGKGRAMNSFLETSRPERMALSRPPRRLHCLSSHQTCPHTASSGFLAGAKMVAQWRVLFLQKEVVFETEPRQGLNREFLGREALGSAPGMGPLQEPGCLEHCCSPFPKAACSLLPWSRAEFSHFVWNALSTPPRPSPPSPPSHPLDLGPPGKPPLITLTSSDAMQRTLLYLPSLQNVPCRCLSQLASHI